MSTELQQFLTRSRLPARLSVQEAAWLLGFQAGDISILASVRLLKPLGRPAKNGPKYFATAAVERLAEDVAWLDRATEAVRSYWERKNRRRGNHGPTEANG